MISTIRISSTSSSKVIVLRLLIEPSSIAPRSEKSNQEEMDVLIIMLAGLAAPVEARSSPLKSKRLVSFSLQTPS
jgi:hypothetical protein